jgi:tRNA/tmRNA/rRNA uracil-C5-methylase (TrmA/RlmC/RlmD family)
MKDYKEHFRNKIAAFTESLRTNGLYSGEIKTYSSPTLEGFRGRAKFKLFKKKNGISIKGTDLRSGEADYLKTLWMLPEWARGVTKSAAEMLQKKHHRAPVDGWEIRIAHGREKAVLILSVKRNLPGDFAALGEGLLRIPGIAGVLIPSLKESYGTIFLRHSILRKDFVSPAASFFQAHLGLTSELIREIRLQTQTCRYERWIDLYCGSGLLALFGADSRKKIFGLDSDAAAVACARNNAGRFNRNHACFETGKVEYYERFVSPVPGDLVALDPPRQGVPDAIIRTISKSGAAHVCQVSCSPATAARDLLRWKQSGFHAEAFTALDMFPFTPFLETVVYLKRDSCKMQEMVNSEW